MEHVESEFKGEKGFKIYYQAWLPEAPKAVVQVVHGFAEHSGRYMNIVNALVPRNFAIFADDHRGHGRSEGMRNYVDSFNQFVADEKQLNDIIRERCPGIPVFMLGHSMGSLIATCFTRVHGSCLKGLILSGTGTSLGGTVNKFLVFMARLISKLAPRLKINPGLEAEMLSHDPEVVKAYKEDPLVHAEKITARLGWEMLKSAKEVISSVENFKLPMLVQCGSEDSLVKGAEEEMKDILHGEDKTIIIYDGLYHEVYNEVEERRGEVLKDLSEWLESHI